MCACGERTAAGMAMALTQINGYAHVAERYGFEEAVFLDSIVYWYRTNRANNHNFRDGRWWTYNSIKAFEDIFPWWSAKQIRRIAASCREQGALIAGEYNEDRRDRSLWYTPGDELLALYGLDAETGKCTRPNGQMQVPERAEECAQMGECNIRKPCNYHEDTNMTPYSPPGSPQDCRPGRLAQPNDGPEADKPMPKTRVRRSRQKKSIPTHAPKRFEQFWQAYPGGGSRLKAVEEWDNLAPSDELIDEMARALKRQMGSRLWREGIGIPHAFRWIRDRRWTDKLPEEPRPRDDGGWADDPEVPS